MFDKLLNVENKLRRADDEARHGWRLQSDAAEYRRSAKTLSELEPLVQKFREYKAVDQDITGAQELVNGNDAEMRDLAREELKTLVDKARRRAAGAEDPPDPERSQRRKERHPRNPRRHRRRRGRALRRRPVPDVAALRRAPGLEDRGHVHERERRPAG